jgi:hypothetical protein
MPVHREDSDFPFVRLRPVGRSTDADIEENLAFLAACLARHEPFTVLFDARHSSSLTGAQRRAYASWFARNEREIARYFRGGAAVSGSPFVRAAITTIFFVYRPPFPYFITSDMNEAEVWLGQRMFRRDGVSEPG